MELVECGLDSMSNINSTNNIEYIYDAKEIQSYVSTSNGVQQKLY